MRQIVVTSIAVVAGWAGSGLGFTQSPPEGRQPATLTFTGSLTSRLRIALPRDSRAVIELRDAAAAQGAPAVAEQRIDLKGRQVPIAFELVVDRARLVAGAKYVLRGGIVSGAGPIWASPDVAVDVAAQGVDVGALVLARVPREAFKSELLCGTERITVSVEGRDIARVAAGGRTYEMRQVRTASGAKYEVPGDPTTSYWSKGRNATLVIAGKTFPECKGQ